LSTRAFNCHHLYGVSNENVRSKKKENTLTVCPLCGYMATRVPILIDFFYLVTKMLDSKLTGFYIELDEDSVESAWRSENDRYNQNLQ